MESSQYAFPQQEPLVRVSSDAPRIGIGQTMIRRCISAKAPSNVSRPPHWYYLPSGEATVLLAVSNRACFPLVSTTEVRGFQY